MRFLLVLITTIQFSYAQNDFLFKDQWNFHANGQSLQRDLNDLHVENIIASGKTNWGYKWWLLHGVKKVKREIIVAVLDSGIDVNHPELKDSILDKGRNFAPDKEDFSDDVFDHTGHGTHVSGVIAAKNNQSGVAGFGDFIKILPIKIFHKNESQYKKKPLSKRIIQGINYAVEQGADIINLSLGWPKVMHSKRLQKAIDDALKAGVMIVSASGNSSNVSSIYPCIINEVICVGSVGPEGKLSGFSNFAQNVDVLAPGEMILSTYPMHKAPLKYSVQGYEIMSGTSQAAPLITGMIAAIKAVFPLENSSLIKKRLFASSKSSQKTLFGIPNLKDAIMNPSLVAYPQTKGITQIILDSSREFELTLPIIGSFNKVEIESDKIKVNLSEDINSIKIYGQVGDQVTHSKIKLKILPSNKIFFLSLEFLESQKDNFKSAKVISKRRQPLLVKDNVKLISRLKVVTSLKERNPQSLFYYNDQKNKLLSLYIIKDEVLTNFVDIDFTKDCRLLKFYHLDIDKNNTDEYLLESYCSNKKEKFLEYRFFDSEFNQIHGPYKFLPEVALINYKNAYFFKQNNEVNIAFSSMGEVPSRSINSDPWADVDNKIINRLYILKNNGEELVTYQIDDFRFKESQSLEDYKLVNVKFEKTLNLLVLTGATWQRELIEYQLDLKGDIIKSQSIPVTGLIDQGAFVGLMSGNIAIESFFTPFNVNLKIIDTITNHVKDSYVLKTDLRNPILGTVGYFSNDTTVLRSYRFLHLLYSQNGVSKESRIPYQRLDFLGVKDLQEKVTLVTSSGNELGKLIVDGTHISLESIKVYSFLANGNINKKNLHIPISCASIGQTKGYLNFLCIDKGKVAFKQLNI